MWDDELSSKFVAKMGKGEVEKFLELLMSSFGIPKEMLKGDSNYSGLFVLKSK